MTKFKKLKYDRAARVWLKENPGCLPRVIRCPVCDRGYIDFLGHICPVDDHLRVPGKGETCPICGKPVLPMTTAVWVLKKNKQVNWYHIDCYAGGPVE